MFDEARWSRLRSGAECPLCDLARLEVPGERTIVANLPSGHVVLRNDADFRGYCMLILRRHRVEIFDLSEAERREFIEDASRLARVIQECCGPAKLNYAMLGNEAPHLHLHVIPRYPDDGWWGRSPWARPDADCRTLSPDEIARLAERLREALR